MVSKLKTLKMNTIVIKEKVIVERDFSSDSMESDSSCDSCSISDDDPEEMVEEARDQFLAVISKKP